MSSMIVSWAMRSAPTIWTRPPRRMKGLEPVWKWMSDAPSRCASWRSVQISAGSPRTGGACVRETGAVRAIGAGGSSCAGLSWARRFSSSCFFTS